MSLNAAAMVFLLPVVHTLTVLLFMSCWWMLLQFNRSGDLKFLQGAAFVPGLVPADSESAMSCFERPVEIRPLAANTSLCPLVDLYGQDNRLDDIRVQQKIIPEMNCDHS